MADLSHTTSIIILNANSLNIPNKTEIGTVDEKL